MNLSDYYREKEKYIVQIPFSNSVYRFPKRIPQKLRQVISQAILNRTRCCVVEKYTNKRNTFFRFVSGTIVPHENMLSMKFNKRSNLIRPVMLHKCVAIFSLDEPLYLKYANLSEFLAYNRYYITYADEVKSSDARNHFDDVIKKQELINEYYKFLKRKDFFLRKT